MILAAQDVYYNEILGMEREKDEIMCLLLRSSTSSSRGGSSAIFARAGTDAGAVVVGNGMVAIWHHRHCGSEWR